MSELISVIVPIYKVENYLPGCIESILNQTYRNLEIILVDDGSPDHCGQICDEYQKKDARIKVIHKENGGLSDARNVGIDIAAGEYLTFIDSDDLVTASYVENLYRAICVADAKLAASWFKEFEEDEKISLTGKKVTDEQVQILNTHDCMQRMLCQDGVETSAWGKLYHRSLFVELRYPKGKIYEDIPVTYRAIHMSERAAVIDSVDYYYLQRRNSIQYQSFNPSKLAGLEHMYELLTFVADAYPDLQNAAAGRYFSVVCNLMFQLNDSDHVYRKDMWRKIRKYRWCVLVGKHVRKKARLAALLSYFGYGVMRKVYSVTQARGGRG